MARARLHCFISGRVQGVSYRAYTQREAMQLGLTGWVRNCPDGRVELEAEGEEAALQHLLAWCRQGPPAAIVAEVETQWDADAEAYRAFDIRR